MVNDVVLSGTQKKVLSSIMGAQKSIDRITRRLATGLKVNSALDDPQNFFTAKSLNNRAVDLSRLLDGIRHSIHTIELALNGLKSVESLLHQAEAVALNRQVELALSLSSPPTETSDPLPTQIQAETPEAYWRLDDSGNPAVNGGSAGAAIDGTYVGPTLDAPPLYAGGGNSARFDGIDDLITIPNNNVINTNPHAQRTVELVFEADTVSGRQVLYEEGAATNGFTIYIDNGRLYITGEDDGDWVDADISAPITAGTVYHAAFVFDQTSNSFTGYLNGTDIGSVTVNNAIFPSHSGNIGIGGAPDGVQFHDGEDAFGGFFFDGRISDVALYNKPLPESTLRDHALAAGAVLDPNASIYNQDFENIMDQIDQVIEDANFRGISLLGDTDLITHFNEDLTNSLLTKSAGFSAQKLGILRENFNNISDIDEIILSVKEAVLKVRNYGISLTTDLSIIATRMSFTQDLINTHVSGSQDITAADMNEEGANQLAAETRLELSQIALSLASETQSSILTVIGNGNGS